MKKVSVPPGLTGAPPLERVAVSRTEVPGANVPPGELLVTGSRHDLSPSGPVKSASWALNDCETRVCGRKVLKQPLNPRALRSTAPSRKSLVGTVSVCTPLVSRHAQPPHGMSTAFTSTLTAAGAAIAS